MLVKELGILSCLRRRVPFIRFDSLVNGLNLALRWWCMYTLTWTRYVTEADEKLRPEFGRARNSHNQQGKISFTSAHLEPSMSPLTCHIFSFLNRKHKFFWCTGDGPHLKNYCSTQSKHFIMIETQWREVPLPGFPLFIAQEMSQCLTLQRICPDAKVPMPSGLKTGPKGGRVEVFGGRQ